MLVCKYKNLEPKFSNRIKVIKFEDLVCKYDRTKRLVFEFLGIHDKNHNLKKEYFDPKVSIKNIGQWQRIKENYNFESFNKKLRFFYNYYNY